MPIRNIQLVATLHALACSSQIIVSGSVLLANPTWSGDRGHCSGDDWDCYNGEQRWLLNLLMESGDGNKGRSPIVLAGDYHFSDLRRVCPGEGKAYGEVLGTNKRPDGGACVYQHMASGLSHTTAVPHTQCEFPPYIKDRSGMREEAGQDECSIVQGPNWGEVKINGETREVELRIREGTDGGVKTSVTLDVDNRFAIKRSKTYTLSG